MQPEAPSPGTLGTQVTGTVAILIPAAGRSDRMRGEDKLLRQVDGLAQLRRIALFALSTGARVIVTLPPDHQKRRACLDGLDLCILEVADCADGVSASLRAGARTIGPGEAVMIVPADMPAIVPESLLRLLRVHHESPDAILAGAQGTLRGHPVLFPADLVGQFMALNGDVGARDLVNIHQQRLRLVQLASPAALLDLDTAEAWDDWEASRAETAPFDPPIWLFASPFATPLNMQSPVVMAIITGVEGASYRDPGTAMAIFADGTVVGNLTNGCIEADLVLHAAKVIAGGLPVHLRYGTGSPFIDIRLPCGGAIDVTLFPAPSPQTLCDISCLNRGRGEMSLEFGSDGQSVLRAGHRTGWQGNAFSVGLSPALRILVFGEGPETAVFAQMARAAGYGQLTLSSSKATLNMALSLGCSALPLPGSQIEVLQTIDPWTAVVTFFHDHATELPIIAAALNSPAFYVGAQGSLRVAERRRIDLRQLGLPERDIGRLHAPIGLIPSTRDPRTLAISVLAQIAVSRPTA